MFKLSSSQVFLKKAEVEVLLDLRHHRNLRHPRDPLEVGGGPVSSDINLELDEEPVQMLVCWSRRSM